MFAAIASAIIAAVVMGSVVGYALYRAAVRYAYPYGRPVRDTSCPECHITGMHTMKCSRWTPNNG